MKRKKRDCFLSRRGFSRMEILLVGVLVASLAAMTWHKLAGKDAEDQAGDQAGGDWIENEPQQERTVEELSGVYARDEEGLDDPIDDGFTPMAYGLGDDDLNLQRAAAAGVTVSAFVRNELEMAMRDEDGRVRVDWSDLGRRVRRLDEASLPEAWHLVQALPWSEERQDMLKAIMGQWAHTQPRAALEFAWLVESSRQRRSAMSAVAEAWGAIDPEGALAWYREHTAAGGTSGMLAMAPVFESYYRKDSASAMAALAELPSTSLKQQAMFGIFFEDGKPAGNLDDLRQLVVSLETPEDRAAAAAVLARVMIQDAPNEAVAWLDDLEEGLVKDAATRDVVRHWARVAPDEAFAYLADQDELSGEVRKMSVGAAYAWVRDNPYGMYRYIEDEKQSPARDVAIEAYLRAGSKLSHPDAFALASEIGDPKQKTSVLDRVAREWFKKDKKAATIAVLDSDASDDLKRRLAMEVLPKQKSKTDSRKSTNTKKNK